MYRGQWGNRFATNTAAVVIGIQDFAQIDRNLNALWLLIISIVSSLAVVVGSCRRLEASLLN